ncbi:MAG: type IV toxin-antitoxin system AbiEi family antitoxin domain-containing protein [Actinomycetota bacterium]
MGYQSLQPSPADVWALAARQHGVIARAQLLDLGFSPKAIKHRIANGRLHPVRRGVYALGRPELTRYGRWMAAVLRCGPDAVLSHASAAALWEIGTERSIGIQISVPADVVRRPPGIVVHRRAELTSEDTTRHLGIPVTTPVCTLVDIALRLTRAQLEAAINEADKHDLADPQTLRSALGAMAGSPGVVVLRETLDRRTFTLTDSELERRFLPIARAAGLPPPETGRDVKGFKVDFYWPGLGLVVETDGLRYHRTPAQQARDRLRDQTHVATGLTPLRFTHAQVQFEPDHVRATLTAVAHRLGCATTPLKDIR